MTPDETQASIEKATLEELCHRVIWESIMESTAHCGWTERARTSLVKYVQESVSWAIKRKTPEKEMG